MTVTAKHQALAVLIAKELEKNSKSEPADVIAPWLASVERHAVEDVLDRLQAAILAHPNQDVMQPLFSFVNGEYSLL